MRNGHLGRIKRLEKLARPCRACAIRESRGYEIEWVDDLEDEDDAGGGFECEECGTWIEDLTVTWAENLPPRPEPRPWARFE